MSPFGNAFLFRFTDELQARFEVLQSARKSRTLTPDEEAELAGISELSRIFTFINAQLAAQTQWCSAKLESLYDDELGGSVNIATPQNT
jgi:hypothetical protein